MFLSPAGHDSIERRAFTARVLVDQIDSINFPRFGYGATMNVYSSQGALGATDSYTKGT